MKVHLLDGTYELFRQHFGRPSRQDSEGAEVGAAHGVITSVASMLGDGVSHIGVATDHVIESFRNGLWAGYKTGAGIPAALESQFALLEEALVALGVQVWPMVELEADDALASAAAVASADSRVDQVIICSPDKDLAQCVEAKRVVQLDRRKGIVFDEGGVVEKFGVFPRSIPDWLALVGDTADGFPGITGWGKRSASLVLAYYEHIGAIPAEVAQWDRSLVASVRGAEKLAARLDEDREVAELFHTLATLRIDRKLLSSIDALVWQGPAPEFAEICRRFRDDALNDRVVELAAKR